MKRGAGTVLVVRDASTNIKAVLMVSTKETRRLLQIALTAVSTVAIGVAVNMVTNGSGSYWETVSLVLDVCLLSGSLLLQLVIASCWKERT